MASAIKNKFTALKKQFQDAFNLLLETEPDYCDQIYSEVHTFAAELDSLWACHVVDVAGDTVISDNLASNASTTQTGIPPPNPETQTRSPHDERDATSQASPDYHDQSSPISASMSLSQILHHSGPNATESNVSSAPLSVQSKDAPHMGFSNIYHRSREDSGGVAKRSFHVEAGPARRLQRHSSEGAGRVDENNMNRADKDTGIRRRASSEGRLSTYVEGLASLRPDATKETQSNTRRVRNPAHNKNGDRNSVEYGHSKEHEGSHDKGHDGARDDMQVEGNSLNETARGDGLEDGDEKDADDTEGLEGCEDSLVRLSASNSKMARKESSIQRKPKIGSKRKISISEPGPERHKRAKTRIAVRNHLNDLKDLELIPQNIIQPLEVYETFIDRTKSEDESTLWLLTRLFFAVASPDAFHQLRDACAVARLKGEYFVPQESTVSQTIQALDRLETAASTNAILRRFYLSRLADYRIQKEAQYQPQLPDRVTRSSRTGRGPVGETIKHQKAFRRASSIALADLMAEAYPDLEQPRRLRAAVGSEYERKHKSLKNRLSSGRNWRLLEQKFSAGILALVPISGDFDIQNYEVEKLPLPLFQTFLDVLSELRGDFLHEVCSLVSQHIHNILNRRDLKWRYVFEKMDAESLKREPLDSPNFIQYCELG